MEPRQRYRLPLPGRAPLELGERTLVMGIINVTPDSFADDGHRCDPEQAIADSVRMIEDGVDILDVGGESTRPGADPVPEEEELRRVLPVVAALAADGRVPVSIDTYRAAVARAAIERGATIVNDVSGLQFDAALGPVVATSGAAIVLMHNRGRSRDMYQQAAYGDVTDEIKSELGAAIERARTAGIPRQAVIVDPGIGFSKRAEHSWKALASLGALRALDLPILVGPSRKSFLTAAVGDTPPPERDWATAAAVTASVLAGAHIVRVHAVREMVHVVRAADRIRQS